MLKIIGPDSYDDNTDGQRATLDDEVSEFLFVTKLAVRDNEHNHVLVMIRVLYILFPLLGSPLDQGREISRARECEVFHAAWRE